MRVTQNPANGVDWVNDELFVARVIDAGQLARDDIVDLLTGSIAAVGIQGLLSSAMCAEVMARISDLDFSVYNRERVQPPIARFGPVLNDFKDGRRVGADYWRRVSCDQELWCAVMGMADPFADAVSALEKAWGRPFRPARIGGRPLFAGAVRETNQGARVHFDDVRRECGPALFDQGPPVVQLAFNTWISTPRRGGTTRIWRRRWRPADSGLRRGYGYDGVVIAGEQSIGLNAEPGEALLFDSRNFHSVDAGADGRRLSVSFFIGLTSDGELVMWS